MADDKSRDRGQIEGEVDTEEVVRGVTAAPIPQAKRIRPIAGFVLLVLVAAAALYMGHAMKQRQVQKRVESDTAKAGQGPADRLEKSLLDDQAKHGIDTGQNHVADLGDRSSLAGAGGSDFGPSKSGGSVPPLQYRAGANTGAQQPTPEEQRRLHEYQLEQQALEAPTAVKSGFGGSAAASFQPPTAQPGKSAVAQALDTLRAQEQDVLKSQPSQTPGNSAAALGALASALKGGAPGEAFLPQRPPQIETEYQGQNGQDNKESFLEKASAKPAADYLSHARTEALGKYEVKSGWMIPAVLEQQLNSDLPGLIRALVRENIYDTVSGRYIVIPAGSRLIGIYNSSVGYGQGSVQAVWTRLLFPDGSSMDLGKFEGDDSQGASGFRDQVNNHWGRVFSGALLTSAFAAGIGISQGQNSSVLTNPSYGQRIGEIVGQQVGTLGTEVTRRNLNIQPTLRIRPGYRFNVRVEKDLLFREPYTPKPAFE
jgi:type IV secretory pathway VirB10-like protein